MNFHHKTRHRAPVLLPALPAPQQALLAVPIPPCLRPPRWVPTSAGHDVAPSEMPIAGFLVEHRFCRNALRKVVYFSPLSKDGGAKNICVMFFLLFDSFLGGYDQGWPKNDVVFFWLWVHKLFLFLVLDLNHQILHWNTPCFTNIRIASSIWMNPSLCVSPSCKHLCH